MAFTRYAYDCDPDPAFAWDATEEWLAASDGQQAHTRTTLDDMEEGVGIYDPDHGWELTVSLPAEITKLYQEEDDEEASQCLGEPQGAPAPQTGSTTCRERECRYG